MPPSSSLVSSVYPSSFATSFLGSTPSTAAQILSEPRMQVGVVSVVMTETETMMG